MTRSTSDLADWPIDLDVLQMLPLGQSAPALHAVVSDPYIAVFGARNTLELFYVDAMSGLLAPHIIPTVRKNGNELLLPKQLIKLARCRRTPKRYRSSLIRQIIYR